MSPDDEFHRLKQEQARRTVLWWKLMLCVPGPVMAAFLIFSSFRSPVLLLSRIRGAFDDYGGLWIISGAGCIWVVYCVRRLLILNPPAQEFRHWEVLVGVALLAVIGNGLAAFLMALFYTLCLNG